MITRKGNKELLQEKVTRNITRKGNKKLLQERITRNYCKKRLPSIYIMTQK